MNNAGQPESLSLLCCGLLQNNYYYGQKVIPDISCMRTCDTRLRGYVFHCPKIKRCSLATEVYYESSSVENDTFIFALGSFPDKASVKNGIDYIYIGIFISQCLHIQ